VSIESGQGRADAERCEEPVAVEQQAFAPIVCRSCDR
jgi:hypothetical protein